MSASRLSVVVAAAIVCALVAIAPPPASAQGVYVCVSEKDGAMRYLGTAPGPCQKHEVLVSLPLQGPVGPQGPPGPPGNVGDLPQRVAALETDNRWSHFSTIVDCAAGQSVAAALQEARPYASAEIGIRGVCQGGVAITRADVHLYGAGEGAGLTLSGQPLPVVEIAAMGARLDNLTLTGGFDGMTVDRGASVQLWHTTVTGSTRHGVFVENGGLSMSESAVIDAGGTGVLTRAGATVYLHRSSISHSANDGLLLQASVGFIGGESAIELSGGNGILLYNGATVDLEDSSIAFNGAGVTVMGGSSVHVNGNTNVVNNTGNGFHLEDTSVVTLWGGALGTWIAGNGGWGVYCGEPPAVGQISGNIAPGVTIERNSEGNVMPRCTYPAGR